MQDPFVILHFFLLSVMPIEIFLIWHQYPWPFGNIGCGFITLASELVTHVSIITMIAFTIERYIFKVSLLGVDSLWGDCTFIPADWGS